MLKSQKPSGPWEVEEDLPFADIAARRRRSPGPPSQTRGTPAAVFNAEYAHIRSFNVTDIERISAHLGIKVPSLEIRIQRARV